MQPAMTTCVIRLLFVQLMCFFTINAEYLSIHDNTTDELWSRSGRSKRSPCASCPSVLDALIKTEEGRYIHLKWTQTDQYLSNEYLPVWTVKEGFYKLTSNYKKQSNVMKDIGTFVTYHDAEQSSAVVYFEKTGTIHGVIDTKYYIDDLPIALLNKCHKVGHEYVKKRDSGCHGIPSHPDPSSDIIKSFDNCDESSGLREKLDPSFLSPQNSFTKSAPKSRADLHKCVSSDRRRNVNDVSENIYVETLVFVANDITQTFKNIFGQQYLAEIVIDHIVYFNAVDMILAKLKKHDINIYFNLAGFVIEDAADIFSSFFKYPGLKYSEINNILDVDDIDSGIEYHLKSHRTPFDYNSFDYIVLTTSRAIRLDSVASGVTFHDANIYLTRMNNEPYSGIPLTIMHYKYTYENYCAQAHEVGHSFEVDHDPLDSERLNNGKQCYHIMQEKNSYCSECIDWSEKSINEFKTYMGHNLNRCFLLNYPRSLSEDKPRKFLSPCQQCHCYRYDSYGLNLNVCPLSIPANSCRLPLLCAKAANAPHFYSHTILPFDGTPCGKNKVCWRQSCVHI